MSEEDIAVYLTDDTGVRNDGKLRACVHNARVLLDSKVHLPALFLEHFPHELMVTSVEHLPRTTEQTDRIASYLRSVGFMCVGPVTVCSLAQAAGYIQLVSITESK